MEDEPSAARFIFTREHGIGDGKLLRVFAAEVRKRPNHPVGVLRFPEFAYRRHKLIAHDGQIVVVREPSALALRHVDTVFGRVRAAVVHVESGKVRPAAQLDDGEREGVHRLHHETPVVARRHAAAEFAGKIRIPLSAFRILGLLCTQLLRGDYRRSARWAHGKRILVAPRHRLELAVPESLRVVTVERNHLAERRLGSVEPRPAGPRVHRHVISRVHGELLECLIIWPRPAAFVLQLNADNRTAVLPEMRRHFRVDALEQLFRLAEKTRVA